MTTVANGVIGGLLGGLLAVRLTRLTVGSRVDPVGTADAASDAGQWRRWRSIAAVTVYGGLAGGAMVAIELYSLGVLGVPPSLVEAYTIAVAWGAVLCGAVLGLGRFATNRVVTARQTVVFHVLYAVWLGGWIRFTWLT